jgi:hypothetical protein
MAWMDAVKHVQQRKEIHVGIAGVHGVGVGEEGVARFRRATIIPLDLLDQAYDTCLVS